MFGSAFLTKGTKHWLCRMYLLKAKKNSFCFAGQNIGRKKDITSWWQNVHKSWKYQELLDIFDKLHCENILFNLCETIAQFDWVNTVSDCYTQCRLYNFWVSRKTFGQKSEIISFFVGTWATMHNLSPPRYCAQLEPEISSQIILDSRLRIFKLIMAG